MFYKPTLQNNKH